MKFLPPLTVTDAMLVSSTVPEFWDHAAWSSATTYSLGQRAVRLNRIYESAIAENHDIDPAAGSTSWIEIGPTTRWAMFDPAAGPRTTRAGTLTVALEPGQPVGALGLVDVTGASVRVQVSAGGPNLYDVTEFDPGATLTFLDLPAIPTPTIVVTIEPLAGMAAVGKLLVGNVIDLGTTETGPSITIADFSRRETDDFGTTTVVERPWAKRTSLRSRISSTVVDRVQRQLVAARARPALWIGEEGFEALTIYGFYKEFSIDLKLGEVSYCSLTIEGLPEVVTDGDAADPALSGASDFKVVRVAPIAGAQLQSTTVAENDHPEWSAITNYAAGARVIRAATHRVYESAVGGNVGHDPAAGPVQWLDVGPTNRWAMFDQALGTVTSAVGQIVVVLAPAAAISALALLDIDAASVRVQAPGYDRTQNTATDGGKVTTLTFLDLAVAAGASVTVTIDAGAGQPVSIGTLLVGTLELLGVIETSPTISVTDYSRKETNDFGSTVPVERAWAKRMTVRSMVATDAVDGLMRRVASLRAKPSLWIGREGFDSLAVFGFYRDFSVQIAETVSICSVTLEGLSTAAPLPAPEPRINWVGDWESDASYSRNAIVRHLGRSFASLVDDNLGNVPPDTAEDNAFWYLVADRGDDGADGANGIPGAPGANGQTSYVHFAWANSADGATGFSTTVSTGKLYIGVYSDFTLADSTNPAMYSWTLIKGDTGLQGPTGTPGAPGANGLTPYFHIAYADNATGTLNFTTGDPGARSYIGTYVDNTPADSTNPAAYTWSQYKGVDGTNGIPGAPGANGQTSYVHFAWANNATGTSGFSTTDSAGKLYIGVYGDFTEADSTNPALYSWSKIKGEDGLQGTQGIPGTPGTNGTNGTNGQTTYVHFAYADSADGTVNFTTGAAGGRYYVGVYTDFTLADSNSPAAYTWSLQRGADGANGTPGAPGSNGQPSYVHIAYANNASGTVDFHVSDPTGRTYIGVYTDFTLADSTNPAAYTWSLIKGADGATGAPGSPGVSPIVLDLSVLSMDVAADSNNVTKAGVLPKGSVVSLKQGTTTLALSSVNFTYSDGGAGAFAADYGVIANTVRVTTANAPGWIDVNVVYGGVTYTKRIAISRTQDPQPPQSQTNAYQAVSGGSGTGATTYDGSGVLGPEIVMKANASGQLTASFNAEYYTDTPGGSVRSLTVAARGEIAPQSTGVFSAPLAEQVGTQAFWDKTDATPGIVGWGGTFSGLTPGAYYRVRINTRKQAGSNPNVTIPFGDFSVTQ